eukprot:2266118-Amphidinium_carterae.1
MNASYCAQETTQKLSAFLRQEAPACHWTHTDTSCASFCWEKLVEITVAAVWFRSSYKLTLA